MRGPASPLRKLVLVQRLVNGHSAAEWKRELARVHGVTFDALYTITNMPIGRFLEWLIESGNLVESMDALVAHEIVVGRHCFGCTAGSGSSCGGALT